MKKFFAKGRENFKSDILPILMLIPAIVLSVLVIVFYIPIDYIKYKRSFYCKNFGKRYQLFMGINPDVVFYNVVFKNNLPIQYIPISEGAEREFGWFLYGDTLILPSCYSFSFSDEEQKWVCETEDSEGDKIIYMTLDDYIEFEMAELKKPYGDTICDKAVVLIKKRDVYNAELAMNEPRFLIYKRNMEDAICTFCAS